MKNRLNLLKKREEETKGNIQLLIAKTKLLED